MKDKKKSWLIILSIISSLFSLFSILSFKTIKESTLLAAQTFIDSVPEGIRDRMMLVYNNDLIYILPNVLCILVSILIIYFSTKDVGKKRNLILILFIAMLLTSGNSTSSLASIIGIIITVTIKPIKSENKKIPSIEYERLTKSAVVGSIICLLAYFSHMFLPLNKSIILTIFFYITNFIICLYIFRNEIFSGFKLLEENFSTYIKYILPKLGIMYIIYIVLTLIVVFVLRQGISLNQQEVEKLPFYVSLPLAVIWAPIVEETLFRGCLRKLIKSDLLFIILSGFIFGLLHTNGEDSIVSAFTLMIPYSILGGGFAYIYTKTNNIATNMMCHSVHNFTTIIIQLLLFGI